MTDPTPNNTPTTSPSTTDPTWLADWVSRTSQLAPQRSIVIGSKCSADLQGIGSHIVQYLNEFDEQTDGHWQEFSHHDLYRLAGDPACRDLILNGTEPDPHSGPPDSDLDRVARRIARLGGAVLEGQYSLDATNDLDTAFRVCLCGEHPTCIEPCHIWLNSSSFSRQSLVAVIADSFLDWSSRRPDFCTVTNTGHPERSANRAEPDTRHCASL